MKNYVLGFYFYPDPPCKVVLIQKYNPKWQLEQWNGIGGLVKDGEYPLQAMRREFQKKTGADVLEWRLFSLLTGSDYYVSCYSAMGQEDVKTTTAKRVETFRLVALPALMYSLEYLIPMALDLNLKSSILNL